ncbi:branched chain amino acid aminotransferase apoenzyme [Pseudobacteriovorax antillogorgiicola]|uniref:branched-chain-amino-acid transaminase n=2 Tax=Pseudobacteriovorax antillogorgiicola TaxID=1513793 RepID=A0A1Y6B6Y6_9BACT|nr:branched chain amino acid aminotransferase [Pseudobacteriovorax antillogorgiicola]SME87807.1 branched chain amino acid aminotransferase apoenzyme [Pseudobacteriovorax antillogorgiicola]
MEGFISVNGQISSPEDAQIPVLDRGFLFGDNIFEVFVAFGNTVLDLKPHLDRLRRSAEMHRIPIPWSDEELSFEIQSLIETTNHPKKYIRLVITRGEGIALYQPEEPSPNKVIFCLPARQESEEILSKGIKLKRRQANFVERGATAKTGNYIRSITALEQAKQEGFDDVLWTNGDQELTEATTSNIFLIGREGDLIEIATPPANSGLLLGITRSRIIDLLTNAKIPVTERVISTDEIARFDEGFLCSTVRGLVPIQQIDKHRLHSTRTNAVFKHIQRLFSTWVATEVGYRVNWNTGEKVEDI